MKIYVANSVIPLCLVKTLQIVHGSDIRVSSVGDLDTEKSAVPSQSTSFSST